MNFICGVCVVLEGTRGRPRGILRKGSMRALDQPEQDRGTERGQEMCLRHWCRSKRFLIYRNWEILPGAPQLGSRLTVTFPVTPW